MSSLTAIEMQKRTSRPINEILSLDDEEFDVEFYSYLIAKKINHQPLNEIEQIAYLLLTMLLDIEMEGFVDLFYQLYSLQETMIVEDNLRKLGLEKLADLFAEAKNLYINNKSDITEDEYWSIDPFGDDARWRRFDEIGEEFMAKESEIYVIAHRVREWVKANRVKFI